MKKRSLIVVVITFIVAVTAYAFYGKISNKKAPVDGEVIYIQPFNDIPEGKVAYILLHISKLYPHIKVNNPVAIPEYAWYAPRARYKADSIIKWLAKRAGDTSVIIGLTSKDVSTSKGNIPDWGVMGLGYEPGRACVASSFRLSKNNTNEELYKVCVHELGHNMGLSHCSNKQCYMRDAEGQNTTSEETCFCAHCAKILRAKGWSL